MLQCLKDNWLLNNNNRHSQTSFFNSSTFAKMMMTGITQPLYSLDLAPCDFSLFPQLKGCHFDTNEGIKTELQAALNTLKGHGFQDGFKKGHKCWKLCIYMEEEYLKMTVASRPKVSS
jgi:hypothetical protein